MGHVRESVKLYYGDKSSEVTALIDTGSTTLILPKGLAEKMGVQVMGKMGAELADGTTKTVNYGVIDVEVSGRRAPTIAAIVEGGEICLGVEVLERLGLTVNPATGKIYPTRRFVTRL